MRICIVSGSHRPTSNSAKVARFLEAELREGQPPAHADVISLAGSPLPLWSEDAWNPQSELSRLWETYAERLRAADGLVLVSPEWHGMVPPGLKNFLLFCSPREVAHKPALLVSVSAALGGAYPISELRLTASKNNRMCLVPEHVIVRQAGEVLVDRANPASEHDALVRARLRNGLEVLRAYTESLGEMRRRFVFDFEQHPYGM